MRVKLVALVLALIWTAGGTCTPGRDAAEGRLVLVTGATGRQGGAVARELLNRRYRVRALTRNPTSDRARRLTALGAEVVRGDFDDRASLDDALRGAYGAFSVQNFWEHGFEAEVRQGVAMADAAKAAGVRHFVYTSVGSADRETGIPHFDSKFAIEEHIRAIALPATILRPVAFMDNWDGARVEVLAGKLIRAQDSTSRLQQIAVRDIGRIAAEAFADPDEWLGVELDIAGDDLTMLEIAEVVARVIESPVEYVQAPWDQFERNAGPEIAVMTRWFNDVGYDADVASLRARFPFLLSFENYLRQAGWEGIGAN